MHARDRSTSPPEDRGVSAHPSYLQSNAILIAGQGQAQGQLPTKTIDIESGQPIYASLRAPNLVRETRRRQPASSLGQGHPLPANLSLLVFLAMTVCVALIQAVFQRVTEDWLGSASGPIIVIVLAGAIAGLALLWKIENGIPLGFYPFNAARHEKQ